VSTFAEQHLLGVSQLESSAVTGLYRCHFSCRTRVTLYKPMFNVNSFSSTYTGESSLCNPRAGLVAERHRFSELASTLLFVSGYVRALIRFRTLILLLHYNPNTCEYPYICTGSLTFPPCAETVSWRVLSQPVQMSNFQV